MNDEMFDRARRIVDDARNQTHLREWAEALLAERERAEEAERERDEARRQMQSMVAESLVPAEARCASLKAALQRKDPNDYNSSEAVAWVGGWNAACEAARALLGEQTDE